MVRKTKKVNLFTYLDYRKFLRDFYQEAKKTRAGFSFRTFSQLAGFGSSNFYKLVMDGDRNLTEESVVKFMKGLGLNKQEQEFFRNLVFYTQAKSHREKNHYYQNLLQSRKFNQLKPIEKDQYEYYSTWYHAVVRELITSDNFDGTAKWISEQIHPKVSQSQIEKSLELLLKLGFIRKSAEGKWRQATSLVTTGAESTSLILLNYHQNLLELTRDQLPQIPADHRDVSALTLGVAKERIPQIKKKIQEFRQEILKMVSTDYHPEEVVFLNLQMIPVTRSWEAKES